MGVTRGQLPQRAGSLGLNGGGAAAAVPPTHADNQWHTQDWCSWPMVCTESLIAIINHFAMQSRQALTTMCHVMRCDGQPRNHAFQLSSKHDISPYSTTLHRCQSKQCQEDLNSFLFGELVTTRTPSYYVDKNLKSNNLSLIEAVDVAQNHPLWRLMFMFGATHS